MDRRRLGLGVALAGLYVVVAMATAQLSSNPVRPLFDGFHGPSPYNWVEAPAGFVGNGTQPRPGEANVPIGADPRGSVGVGTPDGQASVAVGPESVPAHPPDAGAKVRIAPFDPGSLGPLPSKARSHSNAYQITFTYQPSATPLTVLAGPSQVSLTAAAPADTMLFSPDGQSWRTMASRTFGNGAGLTGDFSETGYFLVVSTLPLPSAPAGGWWRGPWPYLVALAGVAGTYVGVKRRAERRRRQARKRRGAPTKTKRTATKPGSAPTKAKGGGAGGANKNASRNKKNRRRRR